MFDQKILQAQFSLSSGVFSGGANTSTVTAFSSGGGQELQSGLRMSAIIEVVGGQAQGTLRLAIYGLPLQQMNQLTTLGTQLWQQVRNTITIQAGTATTGLSIVFKGLIYNAYMDAQAMPQVCFRLEGTACGGYDAVKPVAPVSFSGSKDVAEMLQQLAGQMGLQFENNGVSTKLMNPYYPGNAWTQALRMAKHAGVDMVIDKGTMAIMPAGKSRNGGGATVAPPKMVGYPTFRESGLIVKSIWDPAYSPSQTITVQSSVTPACGTWVVNKLTHELDTLVPHGKWFTTMECSNPNNPGAAPRPVA
jgi:hypothetical protein